MKINSWFKALEWTKVIFGTGWLDRFVLIEIKYLFAIYINFWNTIEHDRFHTHAFSSISVGLRGYYYEEQLHPDGSITTHKLTAPYIRFISRNNNHRMLTSSQNAISVTFAGPWDKIWTETFLDGSMRMLSWGRKILLSNSKHG